MRNHRVFKRHRGEWIARPTGGADPNPGLKPATVAWLKSAFALSLLNKSVGYTDSVPGSQPNAIGNL